MSKTTREFNGLIKFAQNILWGVWDFIKLSCRHISELPSLLCYMADLETVGNKTTKNSKWGRRNSLNVRECQTIMGKNMSDWVSYSVRNLK